MSKTTQRERDTYRNFADKSGGDFSDIINELCDDADRLAQAEALLRALAPHISAMESGLGYGQVFSERIDAFLSEQGPAPPQRGEQD